MNTRILRMCHRRPVTTDGYRFPWRVEGIGQLQPVLFGIEAERGITLRIEGVADRHGKSSWCWWILPLSTCKPLAKALFSGLEECHANGTESAAMRLWREHKERESASVPA